MEKLADKTLPEGFSYEWTGTTFQEQKTGNLARTSLACRSSACFSHGGPLRELDPPARHHPDRSPGDVRRDDRLVALQHAARRLRQIAW